MKYIERDNFLIIEKLIKLLDSDDEMTKAVACFDLGEFSRLHSFSKTILDSLEGKNKLIKMIEDPSSIVRDNAMLAV